MERATKRVKKHNFENDEEAEAYVDSLLLGKPELPLEMWVKILSSNPALSLQDIQRMCHVNSLFEQICDSGLVWDEIFRRQFGKEDFWLMEENTSYSLHPLTRLIIRRIIGDNTKPSPPNQQFTNYWEYSKKVAILQFGRVVKYAISMYWFMGRYVLAVARKDLGAYTDYRGQIDEIESDIGVSEYESILRSRLADIFNKPVTEFRMDGQKHLKENKIRKNLFIDEVKILYWLRAKSNNNWVRIESEKYNILTGCAVCGDNSEFACGGCQQQYYCGQECAQKDWVQQHRKLCNK